MNAWAARREPTTCAVALDEAAVGLLREGDLGEAGHQRGIGEAEDGREDDRGDDRGHERAHQESASTSGPSASAGKIIRPAVRAMTATSSTEKVGPSVRNVSGRSRDDRLSRQRAREGEGGDQRHEAAEVERDRAEARREVGRPVAGEGAAVVVALGVVGIEGLGEAVRARVEDGGESDVRDDRDRDHREDHRRHEERADGCELDLARFDLLAEVLGRPPDHQAGHEHGDDDVEDHPVEAGADSAEDDLAGEHVHDGHSSASGRERVVPAVDRAVRGVRRRHRPEGGVGDAEAHLLVGHVAAALAVAGREVDPGGAQHL